MIESTFDGINTTERKSLNMHFQSEQTNSNYASAESSPNRSLISSASSQSLRSSLTPNVDDLTKSNKITSSNSISSLLSQKIDGSLNMHPISLDDPSIVVSTNKPAYNHPLADLTGPSIKVLPSSTSTNALEKLLKQGNELNSFNTNEFQSLPPNILFENARNMKQNQIKDQVETLKSSSSLETNTIQDLVKTTVKTLIENTVKSSIEEITKENAEKEKLTKTNLMPSLFPASNSLIANSTVSSSSPNPDCSPFKLLINEIPNNQSNLVKSASATSKLATTLSPNGSTINEAVALFNSDKPKDDKLIEKLALLNHKEHEKADPILSASTKSVSITESKSTIGLTSIPKTSSQSDYLYEMKSSIPTSASTNSMSVPASSQEFCMSLNLNLAAAAAANASAPIIVCDNTKLNSSPKDQHQSQNHMTEHHRFTSNASTSSIHNDLKMILEESKGLGSPSKDDNKQNDDTLKSLSDEKKLAKESPKPQREPKTNKSKNSSINNIKNKHNKSKESKTTSKNDLMNLIDMMKKMAENKGKPDLEENQKPGRYRYNKEFLQQIRNERAGFIENIYPDIFKAYCYCMNGKYWDPEKYFDIIQYSGDYERVAQLQQQLQQLNPNNKNYTNNKHTKLNNSNKKSLNKQTKLNNNSKESNKLSPLVSLGLIPDKPNADKVLLNLLKQEKQQEQQQNSNVNLIDMLNKKQSNKNILNDLFNQTKSNTSSSAPRHHPVILTAQELELSQLNKPENRLFTMLSKTPDQRSHCLSPNSCGSNSCTSECSTDSSQSELTNSSEAYKQLIKNLSNHPLCTPSSSSSSARSNIDNFLIKLQQKKVDGSNDVTNNGTNLLKQLLKLNNESQEQNSVDKKQKNKNNHHHHHHRQHNQHHIKNKTNANEKLITSIESTTTTTTTTTITKTQFPSVNPHEKPFLNHQQTEQTKNSPLEIILSKMQPKSDEKLESKKQTNEQAYFNSLLNKIMPAASNEQKQKTEHSSGNILKWFTGLQQQQQQQQQKQRQNFSAKTLSEIELMSGHFP